MAGYVVTPQPSGGRRLSRDRSWMGALVEAIDAPLRRHHGVTEFTRSPDCIFRMQVICNDKDVVLADGARVRPGDRIVCLHLWNQQVPRMPPDGATLAWARQMSRALDVSLRELNAYLTSRRDLDDVSWIRADMQLGSAEHGRQAVRISQHYGFEPGPTLGPRTVAEWVHRLGQNIFISMLVLARNAVALRSDSLWRVRREVYLPRQELRRRYSNANGRTA